MLRTVPKPHLVLEHLDPAEDLYLQHVNLHTLPYPLPPFIHLEENVLQKREQI